MNDLNKLLGIGIVVFVIAFATAATVAKNNSLNASVIGNSYSSFDAYHESGQPAVIFSSFSSRTTPNVRSKKILAANNKNNNAHFSCVV